MKNYKFGYARVSTEEQVLDRQIDMLSEYGAVSYTHLRAHETGRNLVCRLLLEKKKKYRRKEKKKENNNKKNSNRNDFDKR